jgi:hypothetical protein
MKLGNPTATGDADPMIIRRTVQRHLSGLVRCYERGLAINPTLRGKVTATFFINGSGAVQAATATGIHKDVSSCIAGMIKAIRFPKPYGSSVRVVYPFVFAPAP